MKDMSFYDRYSVFFLISKILDVIKVFPKILVFRDFAGKKLKILKFPNRHFVEHVILHLYWSFLRVV